MCNYRHPGPERVKAGLFARTATSFPLPNRTEPDRAGPNRTEPDVSGNRLFFNWIACQNELKSWPKEPMNILTCNRMPLNFSPIKEGSWGRLLSSPPLPPGRRIPGIYPEDGICPFNRTPDAHPVVGPNIEKVWYLDV